MVMPRYNKRARPLRSLFGGSLWLAKGMPENQGNVTGEGVVVNTGDLNRGRLDFFAVDVELQRGTGDFTSAGVEKKQSPTEVEGRGARRGARGRESPGKVWGAQKGMAQESMR